MKMKKRRRKKQTNKHTEKPGKMKHLTRRKKNIEKLFSRKSVKSNVNNQSIKKNGENVMILTAHHLALYSYIHTVCEEWPIHRKL